jgi:hypothetical protein
MTPSETSSEKKIYSFIIFLIKYKLVRLLTIDDMTRETREAHSVHSTDCSSVSLAYIIDDNHTTCYIISYINYALKLDVTKSHCPNFPRLVT